MANIRKKSPHSFGDSYTHKWWVRAVSIMVALGMSLCITISFFVVRDLNGGKAWLLRVAAVVQGIILYSTFKVMHDEVEIADSVWYTIEDIHYIDPWSHVADEPDLESSLSLLS